VMSPTTRSGLGEGGLAEGVPTYGGVDSGGARGQLLHGGTPMNRAMAEGCGLTNGVGGQGVVDDQLPHVPEGRPSTTGSASREQGHGKGISHAKAAGMAAGAATMGLAVTADGSMNLPTGSGANVTTGSGANVTTGSGANADIGSGANARRFQGAILDFNQNHNLYLQRTALVTALQARAARVVAAGAGSEHDAMGAEVQGDDSSKFGTNVWDDEVVQEEVRRAVQQAMQQRDNRVNDLQQENLELKQLLMAMIDANAEPRGAQDYVFLNKGILSYMRGIQCLVRERLQDYLYLIAEEQVNNQEAVAKKMPQESLRVSPVPGLQGRRIQQLQQLQLRKDGQDPELLKGSIELPKLPEPYQDTSAVAFLEWIYEAGQAVGSITDRASVWWNANLDLAMTAYHKFQAETPLKRLTIQAGEDAQVDNEKWSRLEKRVMTLLLAAMSSSIKAEITMLRIHRVKDCLFKLYTIFAPGGASERASLIKQLEHIPSHASVVETIAALRRWKKLMGRAAEMGVSLPDGSVLLMALEGATKQITEGNKDISFKLNMAKSELGLPHKPTLSNVLVYSDHIAAELQQVIPFNKDQALKLKAVNMDTGSPVSTATSPSGKGQGQKQPCKFWLTDEGCRRGAGCKYGHVFQTKEDKKARCWTCGATTHRQSECPTRSGGKRGKKDGGCSPEQPPALNSYFNLYAFGNNRDLGTPGTTSPDLYGIHYFPNVERGFKLSTTTSFEWIVVGSFHNPVPGAQTDEAMIDLELLLRSQGFEPHQGMALLDSGASHAYRAPRTAEETKTAKRVRVQLADGRAVYLRQNPGGTLLSEEEGGGTILPLGSLVESLGCRLEWTRRHGLRVHHPRYGLLPTKLIGNTPVLREAEALQLIADMEQVEMDKLEAN
ncbi:GIP, partial [Symbiodinium microadriaticum]